MSWTLDIATYVILWWLVLFAVLPFGIKPSEEGDLGYAAGAPSNPRLGRKALITTGIALALWLLVDWAYVKGLIDLSNL